MLIWWEIRNRNMKAEDDRLQVQRDHQNSATAQRHIQTQTTFWSPNEARSRQQALLEDPSIDVSSKLPSGLNNTASDWQTRGGLQVSPCQQHPPVLTGLRVMKERCEPRVNLTQRWFNLPACCFSTPTYLIIHWSSRSWLHFDIWLWSETHSTALLTCLQRVQGYCPATTETYFQTSCHQSLVSRLRFVLKNYSTFCWRRWWWRPWRRPAKPCPVPEILQVASPSCPGPPWAGSLAHLNNRTTYNYSLLIFLSDVETSCCVESFTSFSVIVFVHLDLAEFHGWENALSCSGGGDNAGMRSQLCVCPNINMFSLFVHQTNQLSFHLCNPNHPYITHICVTRRDIQFQRNYRPYPIAATSPSAVRTLNHKTRVSSVSTLILTGSNISGPTKSFWCLQENNKWES